MAHLIKNINVIYLIFIIFISICGAQYYDYQTRGVNSQDCPESEFQLRSLECECSLVQPTAQNTNNNWQKQQQPASDPYAEQNEEENDYTTKSSSSNNVNAQRVILGCLNVDGNKLAQALRRISAANYAIASLTLENAQLRGTRWLPANTQLDDELTIRNSTLGDQSIDELSNLAEHASLQRLTLNRVGLTRVPRLSAAQSEPLSMLNLEDNQIEALDGDDFRQMPSLQALHLSRNRIEQISPESFSKNPLLANLQLDGNQLDTLPGGVFRTNTQLGQLSLRANRFKTLPDDIFDGLGNALYHLNVAENQLESVPPAVTNQLALLEGLNVGSNRIRSFHLSSDLSHLRTLELSNNSMNSLPDGLQYMAKLEQLVSNNNKIRIIPKLPPALKNLQYVSLYQSGVEHICPEAFQNVPSVQHIHLDGHNLTTIPRSAFAAVTPLAVSLGSNQATLVCDCRIAWLADWIRKGILQYPDYVICAGPPGSDMENQPLNRIVDMSCPYVADSDDDVPPECRNNMYPANAEDEDETSYYPGSSRNYGTGGDTERDRERALQEQLNRAQPNQWPSYVHSDKQGMNADPNNNNNNNNNGEEDNTYQVHVPSSSSSEEDDQNREHHRHQQMPTINGYGHSTEEEEQNNNEGYLHHRHGPGAGVVTTDPNDIGARQHARDDGDEDGDDTTEQTVVNIDDDDNDEDTNNDTSSASNLEKTTNGMRQHQQGAQRDAATAQFTASSTYLCVAVLSFFAIFCTVFSN